MSTYNATQAIVLVVEHLNFTGIEIMEKFLLLTNQQIFDALDLFWLFSY